MAVKTPDVADIPDEKAPFEGSVSYPTSATEIEQVNGDEAVAEAKKLFREEHKGVTGVELVSIALDVGQRVTYNFQGLK